MTSTSITIKLLSELGLGEKKEKLFIVSISILEDIVAVFLLSFISNLNFIYFESLIFSLVKSLFIISFLILIFSKFSKIIFSLVPQNDENILMLSLLFLSTFFMVIKYYWN